MHCKKIKWKNNIGKVDYFSLCISMLKYEACPEIVQPLLVQQKWFVWHQCNLAAKESGLECSCVNNDDFTVLVSRGGRCSWVSMCTVWPMHSKMIEWIEQWICIRFCVKLEHSSLEAEFFLILPLWNLLFLSPDFLLPHPVVCQSQLAPACEDPIVKF